MISDIWRLNERVKTDKNCQNKYGNAFSVLDKLCADLRHAWNRKMEGKRVTETGSGETRLRSMKASMARDEKWSNLAQESAGNVAKDMIQLPPVNGRRKTRMAGCAWRRRLRVTRRVTEGGWLLRFSSLSLGSLQLSAAAPSSLDTAAAVVVA
jgi:hypothetical protein